MADDFLSEYIADEVAGSGREVGYDDDEHYADYNPYAYNPNEQDEADENAPMQDDASSDFTKFGDDDFRMFDEDQEHEDPVSQARKNLDEAREDYRESRGKPRKSDDASASQRREELAAAKKAFAASRHIDVDKLASIWPTLPFKKRNEVAKNLSRDPRIKVVIAATNIVATLAGASDIIGFILSIIRSKFVNSTIAIVSFCQTGHPINIKKEMNTSLKNPTLQKQLQELVYGKEEEKKEGEQAGAKQADAEQGEQESPESSESAEAS